MAAAAADQRNLITKASITDIAAKVENDRRECQETSSGPCCVGQNSLRCSHENGKALKEVGLVGEQTVFLGDEKGEIQDM
jgi:hypothetical protein